MRNKVVKKIVCGGAIVFALIGMNGYTASAEWKQNEENYTWNWIENDSKAVGWNLINGTWYYFDDDGTMYIGWLKDNDKWYKLGDDGGMITGWIEENGKWYYAKSSGDLETNMITIDGKTYNFLSDGTMIENTQSMDYSKENVLAINTSIPEKDGYYENNQVESQEKEEPEESYEVREDNNEESYENGKVNNNFEPRMIKPDLTDKHYYSNDNIFYSVKLSPPFTKKDGTPIKGNCTWYAWGRAWEITGERPIAAGFTGNAYEWWQANKSTKKYKFGSEPKVGSLAVWNSRLPGSGGCGHVAIVEKIENGKVYISESMWHGDCFAYKEIYSTNYLDGYIYLDEPNY